MMTPRERELAAIRHQAPDRIPADVICLETNDAVADYLGIPADAVLARLGVDGRIAGVWNYLGDTLPGRDEWGTLNSDDYGTTHVAPLADADLREVERYPWPDPALRDYATLAAFTQTWGDTLALRGPAWNPLFCRVCDLFGMEEAMARMLIEPAVFGAALEAVFAHTAEVSRRVLDAGGDGLPIFYLGDDFATQRGLMISPAEWRRWLKPYFARLFALGNARGKVVWFHSCGDITAILPDLIDIGMDVWETVQLHALPLSPAALKREYGRHITFFGGVNTQRLPFATPHEVADETRRCLELLGDGGGYICGPDHHIKPDVPHANTVALFDTVTAFRKAGYTEE
jgi:uroporphyrinogen decarboxylase